MIWARCLGVGLVLLVLDFPESKLYVGVKGAQ
jgi:hypothetical protein